MEQQRIAVFGSGSYGTALAIHLCRQGHDVRLWGRTPSIQSEMHTSRENVRYLPGVTLPNALVVTADQEAAMDSVSHVLVSVPSHAVRSVLSNISGPLKASEAGLALAAKGLETGSGLLMHEVVDACLGTDYPHAMISGPTFAAELARGLPSAVSVAANDEALASAVAGYLHGPKFRAYTSADRVGVQVGGSVKNVLAIGVGIADGLGLGANTRAMLITRGLQEILRFGVALGAKAETFMGLAGMGDLLLTCTDDLSRNRRFGLALADGQGVEDAQAKIGQVVEGAKVAAEVQKRAQSVSVEMPITQQVCAVISGEATVQEAMMALMSRPSKAEFS